MVGEIAARVVSEFEGMRLLHALVLLGLLASLRARATPPQLVDIPSLILTADLIGSGMMKFTLDKSDGTARLRSTLYVDKIIKGNTALLHHGIGVGQCTIVSDAFRPPFTEMYGIFFLRREGDAYVFADPKHRVVVAGPVSLRRNVRSADALQQITYAIATVFLVSPALITDPSLGLDLGGPTIVEREIANGAAGRKVVDVGVASQLRRAESIYQSARESLQAIPDAVKRPVLLDMASRENSVIGLMQVASTLLQMGDDTALQLAVSYMVHPDENAVVTNTELMLGVQNLQRRGELMPTFVKLAASSDRHIRRAAVEYIRDSHLPIANEALGRALVDQDEEVREAAVHGVCNRSQKCGGERMSDLATIENIPFVVATFRSVLLSNN